MARPAKRYQIRVRGRQRDDIDADLLLQVLLRMTEERQPAKEAPDVSRPGHNAGESAGASA